MRAGARDFLPDPVTPDELLAAISRVASEKSGFETDTSDLVTTFIDAKGGSGGSFLAANFAHICQVDKGLSTLLMDLDRQFAALPQYLDIQPSASLFDALRVVDELDAVAVNGFIARHRSGLGVMAGKHGSGASYYEFDANKREHEAIGDLLDILAGTYQRIVVEVPRHLDEIGAAVLKRSDHIVMVVQQNVPAIRDAARLKKILCTDIGVDADCIKVLVNRYQPNLNTELEDMRSALAVEELFTVPNDYKAVSNSIDMGVPIHELARKSPVTTALAKLPDFLSGKQDVRSKGLLTRSLSALLRS
jgi:pilus assembly protein CpaE